MNSGLNSKWNRRFILFIVGASVAVGQTVSSGSTGSDGALNYPTPGTYVFDPKSFIPQLDPANDGIFNFTTINIAGGVTVRIPASVVSAPVVWLASGAVKIDGTLDLSGQNGLNAASTTQRTYSIAGAGGYPGGYAGAGNNPAGAGLGPGGGIVGNNACGASQNGSFTGNQFLVPLLGGSGGGGNGGHSGGAGGGAILIASSVSISGAGSISVAGGNFLSAEGSNSPDRSGAGSGGGIRLVAPSVTITGLLNADSGSAFDGQFCPGSSGVVRVEALDVGSINASGSLYTATPFGLFLSQTGIPSVKVASVGGNPVATTPTGTFTIPDVIVNSNAAVPFAIQANNVPAGTIVTLVIFSENGPDQTIRSTPLAGTLASSTATASAVLPSGFSKGFVKASFTQ